MEGVLNKDAEKHLKGRLKNWGIWGSIGGFTNLDPAEWTDIMKDCFPSSAGLTPNNADAEHLEEKITSLTVAGLDGFGWGHVFKYIFILEFKQHGRPQELKAEIIGNKFKIPCSMRTYRSHLYRAKRVLHEFVDPI